MRRRRLAVALLSFLLPFCHSLLKAQAGPQAIDVRPFAPTEGSAFEQVSVMNGSLALDVPVWSLKQRGNLKLDFTLRYDSPTFAFSYSCLGTEGPGFPSVVGAANSSAAGVQPDSTQPPTCNPPAPCRSSVNELCTGGYDLSTGPILPLVGSGAGVMMTVSTNVVVLPVTTGTNTDSGVITSGYYTINTPDLGVHKTAYSQGQWRSIDATGWAYQPSNCTLTDRDGTRYVFACTSRSGLQAFGGTLPAQPLYEEDTNGNRITWNYNSNGNFVSWTDTENRTILPPVGSASMDSRCPTGSVSSGTLTIPGVSIPIVFCIGTLSVSTHFLEGVWVTDGYHEAIGSISAISSVILPDGDQWKFTYTPQPGDPNYGTTYKYGELSRIDLPTGGALQYFWGVGGNSCGAIDEYGEWSVRRTWVVERDTSVDGSTWLPWKYAVGAGSTSTQSYQTSVTDPLNNKEVHTLSNVGALSSCSFYDTRVDHYDSTGTLLRTDETDYTAWLDQATNVGIGALPSATRTIWPDGTTKGSTYTYDAGFSAIDDMGGNATMPYGLQIQQKDFDYGTSGAVGSLLRTTATGYWALNNASALSFNILSPPSSVTVTDAVSGSQQITNYSYDGSSLYGGNASAPGWDTSPPNGLVRGNLTSEQRYLNTTATYLSTAMTYNNTGTVASLTLPLTASMTSYGYSSAYQGGALTSVKDALNHSTNYTYDPMTLNVLTAVDVGNNTTTTYNYNPDTRLASIVYPTTAAGQPETDYNYPSSTQVEKKVKQSSSAWITTETLYDGLGRVKETQLTTDPSGTDYVDTTYDSDGRVYSVSNPYHSTNDPTYDLSIYGYDGIGRTLSLTHHSDGSAQSWTYADNVTSFTDETGRVWKQKADGLGRLTQVLEPDGSTNIGSAPTLETDYKYDGFNNLLRVDQWGGPSGTAGERVRLFQYDSLSRLTYACNPESIADGATCTSSGPWSATYTYDANGNVLHKTDARGITINYGYDALNRLTGKTYTIPSPAPTDYASTAPVAYTYDQSADNGLTITNGIGRRTGMTDGAGASAWSYDAMGRTATISRTTNGVNKTTTDTYDLAGEPTNITYYSGSNVAFTYDGAGHETSAIDPNLNINFVKNVIYSPAGGITSMVDGNSSSFAGITITNGYDHRLRMQLTSASTPTATVDSFSYGYYTNGNIQTIVNNVDNTRSQTFLYDNQNRLTSGVAGTRWGNTYVYDPFGSLYQFNQVSGTSTGQSMQTVPSVNNRLTATGFVYDAAGNQYQDNLGNVYHYDAENRVVNVGVYTYGYDGDGNRVTKSSSSVSRGYWYGISGEVLNEFDLSGNNPERNVYFAGALRARRDTNGNTNYLMGDQLGSARIVTTANGAIEDNIDYYPFGTTASYSTSTSTNLYKFTGKERDAESGNDYFGARYYASTMGRFMSPDPSGLVYADITNPQSFNLYAYVMNNPLKFVDPTGLDCAYLNDAGTDIEKGGLDQQSNSGECKQNGGYWVDGAIADVSSSGNNITFNVIGADLNRYNATFDTGSPNQPGVTSFDMDSYLGNAAFSQRQDALQQLNGSPTPQQYIQAIKTAIAPIPTACAVGATAKIRGHNVASGSLSEGLGGQGVSSMGHQAGNFTPQSSGVDMRSATPLFKTVPVGVYLSPSDASGGTISSVSLDFTVKHVGVTAYANLGTFGASCPP